MNTLHEYRVQYCGILCQHYMGSVKDFVLDALRNGVSINILTEAEQEFEARTYFSDIESMSELPCHLLHFNNSDKNRAERMISVQFQDVVHW